MQNNVDFGVRRFGRVNWIGLWTLIARENRRYLSIWQQTVMAPLVTAGLFLLVFSIAIGSQRGDVNGFPFLTFLAPGLLMMTVIQNAFANSSSSLLSSKVMGNIVDTLMPPLSPLELTIGFIAGGIGRALAIGFVLCIAMGLVLGVWVQNPLWTLAFVIFGGAFMAALGLIGAMHAQKFDHMAALTNFVVTPLAFLSGTFYSVNALPSVLQPITWANPMFYIIDGGRYGVIGASDANPAFALAMVILFAAVAVGVVWYMFRIGYRLKA